MRSNRQNKPQEHLVGDDFRKRSGKDHIGSKGWCRLLPSPRNHHTRSCRPAHPIIPLPCGSIALPSLYRCELLHDAALLLPLYPVTRIGSGHSNRPTLKFESEGGQMYEFASFASRDVHIVTVRAASKVLVPGQNPEILVRIRVLELGSDVYGIVALLIPPCIGL